MRKISEVFVVLDNIPGTVSNLLRVLRKKNSKILAIGLFVDSARLYLDNPENAMKVIHDNGYTAELREVLAINLPHKNGVLAELTQKLANAQININYMYGTHGENSKNALLILEVDQPDLAVDLFRTHQF
jgi:hypothetical protein